MGAPPAGRVDVRDMLCAQAVAVVARAAAGLNEGSAIEVRYGTEDVREDVRIWAASRGHGVEFPEDGLLRITRGSTRETQGR